MTNVVYQPKGLMDWSLAGNADGVPIYVKELIYEGTFRTDEGIEFSVDEQLLRHWADTHKRMTSNGIEVPLPVKHTDDPEANRGFVPEVFVETDKAGRKALFGKVQFRDRDAAELAKTAQVSIFSPPKFTDGTGVEYLRPIRHVALTDYPVIPGLEKFEAISASFATSVNKELKMPLKKLATRLGIQFEDESTLEDTIAAAFEAVKTTVSEKDTIIAAHETEIVALKAKIPSDPIKVTASHRSMLKDNRTLKLDKLVDSAKLSPAARDELLAVFCSDDNLNLVLSHENGDDGFDKVLNALMKNMPLELGEGATVVLSKEGLLSQEENPVLKDMARRTVK